MDGAMIAYIPEQGSWCKQDFPHMTLVYAGETSDLQESDFNAMAKDAISVARITGSFSLPVTGVEVFGEGEEAVDVLTLYPTPQLLLARKMVQHWNKSEYTDFKPHATIGPVGSAATDVVDYHDVPPYTYEPRSKNVLPDKLYFNRIAACWGSKKVMFHTNSF